MLGNLVGFSCGVATGIYLSQNYNVPNIRHYIDYAVRLQFCHSLFWFVLKAEKLKDLESTFRK